MVLIELSLVSTKGKNPSAGLTVDQCKNKRNFEPKLPCQRDPFESECPTRSIVGVVRRQPWNLKTPQPIHADTGFFIRDWKKIWYFFTERLSFFLVFNQSSLNHQNYSNSMLSAAVSLLRVFSFSRFSSLSLSKPFSQRDFFLSSISSVFIFCLF